MATENAKSNLMGGRRHVAAGMQSIEVEVPKEVFCECRDCKRKFYSPKAFSDHVEHCNYDNFAANESLSQA